MRRKEAGPAAHGAAPRADEEGGEDPKRQDQFAVVLVCAFALELVAAFRVDRSLTDGRKLALRIKSKDTGDDEHTYVEAEEAALRAAVENASPHAKNANGQRDRLQNDKKHSYRIQRVQGRPPCPRRDAICVTVRGQICL